MSDPPPVSTLTRRGDKPPIGRTVAIFAEIDGSTVWKPGKHAE